MRTRGGPEEDPSGPAPCEGGLQKARQKPERTRALYMGTRGGTEEDLSGPAHCK